MKISQAEREKVIKSLMEIQGRYHSATSWAVMYGNLEDYARSRGVEVYAAKNLATAFRMWGCYQPYLKTIYIQIRDIGKMVSDLAHEVGHMMVFNAGFLKKYEFDEPLADALGHALVDILS